MALYLHLYNTQAEFENVYNSETPAPSYFDCTLGRYTYDGVEHGRFLWYNGDAFPSDLRTLSRNPKVGIWSSLIMPDDPEEFLGAYYTADMNPSFVEITAVEDAGDRYYHEPWVSYTKESATTEVVTAFTCSTDQYPSLTGTFTPVGEFYIAARGETQEGHWENIYDLASATTHVPVWSNGTVYVAPSPYRNTSRNITEDTYLVEVTMVDGHPGFLENMMGTLNQCIQQTFTGEEKLKQTNYNKGKNRIYLMWDGVSMTTVGSGSSARQYPTYVVNQEKSRGGLEMARVYVNGKYISSLRDFANDYEVALLGDDTDYLVFNKNSGGEITCHYVRSTHVG